MLRLFLLLLTTICCPITGFLIIAGMAFDGYLIFRTFRSLIRDLH